DAGAQPVRRPGRALPGLRTPDVAALPDRPAGVALPSRAQVAGLPRDPVQPLEGPGEPVQGAAETPAALRRAAGRAALRRSAEGDRRTRPPARRPGRRLPRRPAVAAGDPAV